MSQFLRLANESLDTIRSAIGARKSTHGDARDRGNVVYVELNHAALAELFDFFARQETDFGLVEDTLDAYSLRGGVKFSFLGEELDDEQYGITDHMIELMRKARQWYHVCGFVPLRDTNAVLDRRLREEVEIDSAQNVTAAGATSVSEISRAMLARAEAIVERAVPAARSDLQRRAASVLGLGVLGPGSVGSRASARSGGGGGGSIAGERDVAAPARRASVRVAVETRERVTSMREPSADLRVESSGGGGGASTSRGVSAATRKRATDIGRTAAETRDNKRRRARQDLSRTLRQALTDLRNVSIPDPSEGRFFVEIDTVTGQRRVVFSSRKDAFYSGTANAAAGGASVVGREFFNSRNSGADGGPRRHSSVHIDEDVAVYVWAKRMPGPEGEINTRLFEVLRMRRLLNMAETNLAEVDCKLAHPTTVLEQQPPPSNAHRDEMLDQQLYGGDAATATPSTEEAMRHDAVTRFVTQVETQVANGRMRSELAREIAERGAGATQLDGDGNQRTLKLGDTLKPFLLPPMVRVTGSAPQPSTVIDVNFFHHRYTALKANVFGLPPQKLSGGTSYSGRSNSSGSGGVTSTTNDATFGLVDDQTRRAVLEDRAILAEFAAAALWDMRYRAMDNDTLTEALRRESDTTAETVQTHVEFMEMIERKLAVAIDIAEQQSLERQMLEEVDNIATLTARLARIDSEIKRKLAMRYRFEVQFNNMSFASPQELDALVAANAIDELQKVNAMRAMYGMPALSDAEYKSTVERNQKVAERRAEFDTKLEADRATAMAKVAEKYGPSPAAASAGAGNTSARPGSGGDGEDKPTASDKKSEAVEKKDNAANKRV